MLLLIEFFYKKIKMVGVKPEPITPPTEPMSKGYKPELYS